MISTFLIGISGVAGSGKTTLSSFIQKKLEEKNKNSLKLSLASQLKKELESFCKLHYGIDIFNCNSDEKNIIRDLMVFHGRTKRLQTNGRYWIDQIKKQINSLESYPDIIIIDDIRYNNEIFWIKKEYNSIIIHLKCMKNGIIIPPANEEERMNDSLACEHADMRITIPFQNGKLEGFAQELVTNILKL